MKKLLLVALLMTGTISPVAVANSKHQNMVKAIVAGGFALSHANAALIQLFNRGYYGYNNYKTLFGNSALAAIAGYVAYNSYQALK